MTLPTASVLYALIDSTWPAARRWRDGPWVLRDGQGGGSRVSAATGVEDFAPSDIDRAEGQMSVLNQPHLFMIRDGDDALDAALAARGYAIKDPVVIYSAQISTLCDEPLPPVTTFRVWPPLQAVRDVWLDGGIGPARVAVMDRVRGPKTCILGRVSDTPAGAAFVACDGPDAMVHAIETKAAFRRNGLARHMLRAAAYWAAENGATSLNLLVTKENAAANALYQSMGMTPLASYHYRIAP